jgi:cytochrome c-type biogenesis protein CcmH/NrfG
MGSDVKKTMRRRPGSPATAPVGEEPGRATHPRPAPARDGRTWLLAVPLILIAIAAFLPALGNGFVDWDDEANFLRNRHYRGLGWPQLRWACTTFLLGVYQPIAWLLLEAQYALFGLDPRGYHLTSLLLHAADAVALYALTLALLVRCRLDAFAHRPWPRAIGAALATALFAVHPLRVEPVAWVSCQPYLPCALFAMLAVLTYLRAVGEGGPPRPGWLAASFALFVASLLSKAAAVPLPAVLLILDVYPLRRLGGGPGRWLGPGARRVWLEKVPFFATGLVFMALAVVAKAEAQTLIPLERDGVLARIAQACYGIWFYVIKTVIPTGITAFYPLPARIDWWSPPFLLSLLATAAVTAGLVLRRRQRPGLLAAWLSYLVILAPSSGLVRIGSQVAADRYSDLAMLGLVAPAAAGLGLPWASPRGRRGRAVALTVAAAAAILGLAALTWAQCGIWRTSESLWSHALEHGGGSSTTHHGLASALYRQGRYQEAMAQYDAAVRLKSDFPWALFGLGSCHFRQGRYEEALAYYEKSARLRPDFAPAHYGLASVFFRRGRFGEALAHFEEAIRLDPDHAEAYNDRAMILATCPEPRYRDGPAAVASATRACELTGWKDPMYLDTLAAASAEAGDFAAAAAWQEKAIGLLDDERRKENYRTRLALYRAKRPFHEESPVPTR